MRLKKELVTQREEYVYNTIKANPSLSAKEALGLLKEKFGQIMDPARFYSIFHAAKKGEAMPPSLTTQQRKDLAAERAIKRANKANASNSAQLVVDAVPVVENSVNTSVNAVNSPVIDVSVVPTVEDTAVVTTI